MKLPTTTEQNSTIITVQDLQRSLLYDSLYISAVSVTWHQIRIERQDVKIFNNQHTVAQTSFSALLVAEIGMPDELVVFVFEFEIFCSSNLESTFITLLWSPERLPCSDLLLSGARVFWLNTSLTTWLWREEKKVCRLKKYYMGTSKLQSSIHISHLLLEFFSHIPALCKRRQGETMQSIYHALLTSDARCQESDL